MTYIFLAAPMLGVLTALAAILAEQLLAALANVFLNTEIIPNTFAHLSFFIVAAAFIEETCKYLALSRVLRMKFNLRGFKFIFAALVAGLFFGLTEIYLVLLANGRKISDLGALEGETLFSLAVVLLTHFLTTFLIAVFIVSRKEDSKFTAFATIIPASAVHLLVNFLIIHQSGYTNWLIGMVLGIVLVVNFIIFLINLKKLD